MDFRANEIGYIEFEIHDGNGVLFDDIQWGDNVNSTLGLSGDISQEDNIDELSALNIDDSDENVDEPGTNASADANANGMHEIHAGLVQDIPVTLGDVMSLGEKGLFIDDGKEQVLVKGKEGYKIELSDLLKDGTDLGDWKQEAGTVTIAGEQYNVYQHSGSDVEVLV